LKIPQRGTTLSFPWHPFSICLCIVFAWNFDHLGLRALVVGDGGGDGNLTTRESEAKNGPEALAAHHQTFLGVGMGMVTG